MKMLTVMIAVFLCLAACAPDLAVRKTELYAPIEASLTHIDQKVAGHFVESGVPDGFNGEAYRAAVEAECFPIPACKEQAEAIFNSYEVTARKVDDGFSVMLCDQNHKWKVMEDFSCNSLRVEIPSWKSDNNAPCKFEDDWLNIVQKYCENQ
jgi:hypothetical protein